MIGRLLAMFGVLLGALLVETVVMPGLAIAGLRPDLVALTLVGFALVDGAETGARYGFAAGLARDLLAGSDHVVGVSALILLCVGYAVGLVRPYISGAVLLSLVALGGLAAAAIALGEGIGAVLLSENSPDAASIARACLVVGLYSAALAPFVARPTANLARRLPGGTSLTATGPPRVG